jgi:hypothetical protein
MHVEPCERGRSHDFGIDATANQICDASRHSLPGRRADQDESLVEEEFPPTAAWRGHYA